MTMTYREALLAAERRLGSLQTARRDSVLLLQRVVARSRPWVIAHLDEELVPEQIQKFESWIVRRVRHEPIQHITGEVEFYGLPLRVTRDVLIPRPETEHLVEAVIEMTRASEAARMVDVGTGSGAIAVALAHALRSERVTAIDLSAEALVVARENAARSGVKVRFLQGDLLEPVANETFDLVVSNPPYVPESDRSSLAVEVREYEPGMALFAGGDGLDIYRRLIPQAFRVLVPGGHVLLEIGFGQAEAVRALLEQNGFFNVRVLDDLQGIPRVVDAMRGKD